ncbi:MAG TPA: bifunctional diguanylate cyclase/phosphodiesterase [Micromonosporaceae bacterium]
MTAAAWAGRNGNGPRRLLRDFARSWARAVVDTAYTPLSRGEVEERMYELTVGLVNALEAEPFSTAPGYELGAALVSAHFVAPETLGRTVQVIDERLLYDLGLTGSEPRRRLAALLGALTTGYARGLRERTLEEQEAILRAALVARDQAEAALRASEARFRYEATHDTLTGLPNRALFADRLAQVFAAPHPDARVGLCFLDLDGFKAINDTLGHQFGDRLLVAVAERLDRWVARGGPLVARMGGDEFVILVEDSVCADEMIKLADAALTAIAAPVRLDGHELTVSASIGIVETAVDGLTPTEIMRRADITLHWAKSAGRGRWALFDPGRDDFEVTRYGLVAAMPAALERGEFFLEYQPLVALADGSLYGVEALVRWRHPTLGVLPPGRFIDLAEETGLIVRLGAHILEQACEQAQRWAVPDREPPLISVNLAVRQVRDPGLVDRVAGVLDRTGLPAQRLQLEITESAVMGTDDEPMSALHALSEMGVRLAVDDFGTGYSNLAYLRDLPVREVKVAGELVAGLRDPDTANRTDERIVATLIRLAHVLGHTVTVEGIETAHQAERLRVLGCDAGQGWHLGRPGPPEEIDRWVQRQAG